MKTVLTLSVFSIAMLLFSCSKKDYTCHCEGGFDGGGQTMIISKSTKGNAETECYSKNDAPGSDDGFSNCELK